MTRAQPIRAMGFDFDDDLPALRNPAPVCVEPFVVQLAVLGAAERTRYPGFRAPAMLAVVTTARFATWNVQHGRRPDDGRVDPLALAATVAELRAEVVALQEVDRGTRRGRRADLLQVAAEAAGLEPVDGLAVAFDDGGTYGNGLLLAGGPDGEVTTLVLPPARATAEPRSLVRCRWRGLTVSTGHLDHRGGAAAQLGAAVNALPAAGPAVLLGDLNLGPSSVSAVLAAVAPGWSTVEVPPAFPASAPTAAIDQVLVRDIVVVEVAPSTARPPVSDHRPVVVTLAW